MGCAVHNIDYKHSCPECRREDEERDRQAIIDGLSDLAESREAQLEDLAYKQANPGDYTCPGCKFITLKHEAVRCPKCRWDIPPEYWSAIRAAKEAKIKAAAAAAAAAAALRKEAAVEEERRTRKRCEADERAAAAANLKFWNEVMLIFMVPAMTFLVFTAILVFCAIVSMILNSIAYILGLV